MYGGKMAGLQGRSPNLPPLRSPFFEDLSLADQNKLRRETMSATELAEFIRGVRGQPSLEEIERDPVVGALWDNQLRRMEEDAKMSPGHWFVFYQNNKEALDDLRQVWIGKVVPSWFQDPENTHQLPHSLLAAEVMTRGGESRIADYIHGMHLRQSNPEYIRELVPEMYFLAKRRLPGERPPSSEISAVIWHAATDYAFDDPSEKIAASPQRYVEMLSERLGDGRENFLKAPLLRDRSYFQVANSRVLSDTYNPSVFQEAVFFSRDWSEMNREQVGENLQQLCASIASECLLRIYVSGADPTSPDDSKLAQEQMLHVHKHRSRASRDPIPFENLRPLFEAEGESDLFGEINKGIRKEIKSGGHMPLGKIIEREVLDFNRLQEISRGEATFSQFIAQAVRSHFFHRGSGGHFF